MWFRFIEDNIFHWTSISEHFVKRRVNKLTHMLHYRVRLSLFSVSSSFPSTLMATITLNLHSPFVFVSINSQLRCWWPPQSSQRDKEIYTLCFHKLSATYSTHMWTCFCSSLVTTCTTLLFSPKLCARITTQFFACSYSINTQIACFSSNMCF